VEIFHSIVSSVFPYSVEEILDSIMSKPEADGVSKTQSFGPLLQAYRDAETCRHRCQILSYNYNLTIMKSPKPATDNRFKK
jgi:hypothetical protein